MRCRTLAAVAAVTSILAAGHAHADLARVGPANNPSPPGHGFPAWYQDLTGQVLDLCLPDASDPGGLQQTACLLPDPPPYAFPDTFPEEVFYHRAVSTPLATGGGKRAILVLALEAAFATGGPVPGQQIVFTRIRVTAGVPFDGTYTVKHPYGTETFPDVHAGAGNRDIVFSEDIGTAPGDFTTALTSRVGPFLQRSASAGGAPLGPVTLNGSQFLSDGVAAEFVTGSPFGTNYFEICGPFNGPGTPDTCLKEETFTLTGKLRDLARGPIGSPLKIDRATYARDDSNTTRVDVAATAAPGIGQGAPRLSVGSATIPPVLMAGPDGLGRYYAQATLPSGAEVPNTVTVTNSGDSPPSKESAHVVDEVTIHGATYDAAAGTLTVVATSSDKSSQHGPPAELAVDGFPNATRQHLNQADATEATLTASGVTVPPVRVRVFSTKGGSARSGVAISSALNQSFGPGVPLALDDVDTATQGTPVVIPVLLNDVANPAAPITGGPTILAPGPDAGTATVNPDGSISYTPGSNVGPVTFRYTVSNAVGTSNVATVTVDVVAGAAGPAPTANPDPTAGPLNVTAGTTAAIDVLANDSANGGTLDPTKVVITTPPASGTATVSPDGKIAFTAPAAAGVVTFAYTVANTNGQVSAPATVTVTVVAPENLQVTSAKCQRSSNTWDVRGTSTISDGNSVQLFLTGTVPAAPTPAQRLGTPQPVALGAWRLQLKGGPACTTPISAQSTLGTKRENVAVSISN